MASTPPPNSGTSPPAEPGNLPSKPKDDDTSMSPGDEAPPGTPGTGEDVCPQCGGRGTVNGASCANCGGTGKVTRGIGGA